MKSNAKAAVLVMTFLLAAMPGAVGAQPTTQEFKEKLANTAIDRARFLISVKRHDEAREVLIDVLAENGLSDETRGRAFLTKGNLGMHISDYKGAKRDYQSVLELRGTSAQLRETAKNGFELAESFEKLRQR